MTIRDRRDSFCGKMSACNNLTQYGIPYSLTTRHTEAPDSELFRNDLNWFAAVCRVVRGLRRLRIGAIGARPAAFNTVRYSEKILEANGISVETIDLSEILGRIARMTDSDSLRRPSCGQIKRYVSTDRVPAEALLKMAKLGAVIDQWMTETEVAISAVQCWTSLEEYFGVVPCTVMSMMSENLMSSACEVDICGVVGMHALQLASETPSALAGLEQQLRRRSRQSGLLPLQQSAEAFFPGSANGFSGDYRRHGGQGEYIRHLRGPRESRADELTRDFPPTTAGDRFAATSAKANSPTIRWILSAARAWCGFPSCRNCCAIFASADSSITSRPISRRWRRRCMKPPRAIWAGVCISTE